MEPKVLCVGLCCLDIVQLCKNYPQEDTDQRCLDLRYQRGGNASNSCTVLSQLNHPCEFLGILSNEQFSCFLQDDMHKCNIDYAHCPIVDDGGCPTSVVLLSISTGSRTIIHHNQRQTDITLKDFEKLNLEHYSWIHFEGRNISEVSLMIQYIENYNKILTTKGNRKNDPSIHFPITISVELEKKKLELLDLLPYADVVFVSKDFAQSRGYSSMRETLNNISQEAKTGATIFSAWGDRGAMARGPDGIIVQSPAFPPHKIIDTLGAGDTFNASVIYYLNKEKLFYQKNDGNISDESSKTEIPMNHNIESSEKCFTEFINPNVLQNAVVFGCRLAGAKLAHRGFEGLTKVYKNYLR